MRRVLPVLLLLLACGEDEARSVSPDAGDGGAEGVTECLSNCPASPQATPADACPSGRWNDDGVCWPAAPELTDWVCPAGWDAVSVALDPVGSAQPAYELPPWSVCRPPEVPDSCPAGELPLPAEGCVAIGPACPTGDWPDESEIRRRADGFDGALHYVRAGAEPGGDGSHEQPHESVAAALDAAAEGDVIALSRGEHAGRIELDRPIAIAAT